MEEIIRLLKGLGFTGETRLEALEFCEDKVNDYWVDCPANVRGVEERASTLMCNLYKGFAKELRKLAQ
jgi:hypothetical protein